MKLHLDSAKGCYSSRVGLNMYKLKTGMDLLIIHLLTYQPPVVLRQFQEHQIICSVSVRVNRAIQLIIINNNYLFSDHSRSRTELQHMPADLNMFNKIIINLATPTNDNDAENNSCVDCVKQAATLGFVPVYFFNYEMGHDNKKETKF